MHKFERGPKPTVLSRTKSCDWDSFSRTPEHGKLGDALYEAQDEYCAYCEAHLTDKSKGHIEHLLRRAEHPESTFDWDNLFFSCNSMHSCGKFKDMHRPKIVFDAANIIDPAKEDPADYFAFTMTGRIIAKNGAGKSRANETIRVFNLNDTHLVQQRRGAGATARPYLEGDVVERRRLFDSLREAHASFPLFYEQILGLDSSDVQTPSA